tara:strand:- start:1277 stop:1399 length:123 start_codon:yes stop_codon:yes gene_type:complete
MHLREQGVLRAIKKGRGFYYNEDDIVKYKMFNSGKEDSIQ